jgi:hypothetical protein
MPTIASARSAMSAPSTNVATLTLNYAPADDEFDRI